jgi:3-methyladenine DNA glycosylase Tag
MYAMMQCMGVVNDHLGSCHVRKACEAERRELFARLDR